MSLVNLPSYPGHIGNAIQLNGSSDYVYYPYTSAFDLGSTDWTIEAYVLFNSVSTEMTVIAWGNGGGSASPYIQLEYNGGNLTASEATSSTGRWSAGGAVTINANTEHHIAAVRHNGVITIYCDGVAVGTTATYAAGHQAGMGVMIGGIRYGGSDHRNMVPGIVSNVRVNNGTALYTAPFTPSTSPLTAVPGTVILTCQGGPVYDAAGTGFPIQLGGTPTAVQNNAFPH